MKFVADEGVDLAIVIALRKINYHVIYIAEDFGGITDQKILDIANTKNSVLITRDSFGNSFSFCYYIN